MAQFPSFNSRPISEALSSVMNTPARQLSSERTHASPESDLRAEREAGLNRTSYSGSGLSLELELSSGQQIGIEIRINQAGGISQLELDSRTELSEKDKAKLQSFLTELGKSVDALFANKESGSAKQDGLFDFANMAGIKDVELEVQQDDGNRKQILEFEKEGGVGRKEITAELYSYDRETRVEDEQNLKLSRQAKNSSQAYGGSGYQWIQDQIDSALSIMPDKKQAAHLSSFFNSGISALFSTASKGQSLLEELGASAAEAQKLVGRSIKVLVADRASQENQSTNNLPDFNAEFSATRNVRGAEASHSDYELAMKISQLSHESTNPATDKTTESQNRRLRFEFQSIQQQAVYEYTWTRDESLRTISEKGSVESEHYRIEDQRRGIIKGADSSHGLPFQEEQYSYKDGYDKYLNRSS